MVFRGNQTMIVDYFEKAVGTHKKGSHKEPDCVQPPCGGMACHHQETRKQALPETFSACALISDCQTRGSWQNVCDL